VDAPNRWSSTSPTLTPASGSCKRATEPSTASIVSGNLGLGELCQNFDVANACLAFLNGMILSKRVEFAAGTGSLAQALMVMQVGLLVTFTIVGIATVILVHYSLPLTIGCAAGFVTAQLAILAAFYWTHARTMPALDVTPAVERNSS